MTDESLECSYEKCTPLFRNLEQANWGDVMYFLDTGYWPGGFFKDKHSPAEQARTWVYRFQDKEDDEGKKRLRWSQLPLHLALVVKAPFLIIQRLLEIYPESVRCTDDQKMLPLHLAMRYGLNDKIVDLLLSAFPDAVHVKAKDDRTPLDCAMRANILRGRILQTFVKGINANKSTDEYVSQCTQEITELREKLKGKEEELGSVRCQLDSMTITDVPVQHVDVFNEKIAKVEQTMDHEEHDDTEYSDNSTLTTREHTREHHGNETDNCVRAHKEEQACSLVNLTFTQEQATVVTNLTDTAESTKHEEGEDTELYFKIIAKSNDNADGGFIERILTQDQSPTSKAASKLQLKYFQEEYKDVKLPLEYFQEEYKDETHLGAPSLIDLQSLQEQAMTMTDTGIQDFLDGAEAKIEALTTQLASEVQKSDAATREEIRVMQRMIEELKLTADANAAAAAAAAKPPSEEVSALKLEIEELRKELKQSMLEVALSRSQAEDSVASKKRRAKVSRKSKGRRQPFASILRPSDSTDSVGNNTASTQDSNFKANAVPNKSRNGGPRKMNWLLSFTKPAGRKQIPTQIVSQDDPINALRQDFDALRKQLSEMQRVPQVPTPSPVTVDQTTTTGRASLEQNQATVQATKVEDSKPPPTVVPVTAEAAELRMELDALRDLIYNR